MKIKDLDAGMIIWQEEEVLGITGATLPQEYYEYDCTPVPGNSFDWEIVINK